MNAKIGINEDIVQKKKPYQTWMIKKVSKIYRKKLNICKHLVNKKRKQVKYSMAVGTLRRFFLQKMVWINLSGTRNPKAVDLIGSIGIDTIGDERDNLDKDKDIDKVTVTLY